MRLLTLQRWRNRWQDFVSVSFYKMFGYPTGVGALLVRKEAGMLLSRPYFSGGTVEAAISDGHFHKPRGSVSSRFEDGTISFLAIGALHTPAACGAETSLLHI